MASLAAAASWLSVSLLPPSLPPPLSSSSWLLWQ
jgi:hypothetical protein